MADSKLLRQKIAAIRPLAALRQGAVMVAILMPDKTPTDQIDNDDVLWIKCPGSKSIATVLKAYAQRDTQNVKFIQRPNLLVDSQLVSSLIADDELCIIEAVREVDVPSRLHGGSNTKTPSLMRDITNNAINQMHMSPPDHLNASKSKFSPPHSQTSVKPVIFGQTSTASNYSSPVAALSSASSFITASQCKFQQGYELLHLAWTDFTFERREHHGRSRSRQPLDIRADINKCNVSEWEGLSSNQRQFFVDRVKDNFFPDLLDRRAFWAYYYDEVDAEELRGVHPHRDFATTTKFFASKVTTWKQTTVARLTFRDRVV